MRRHSHFQITGMIGAAINPLAKNAEPATERCVFGGKTETRADVRQIEDEVVDRIRFIFERSGDGQTFAGLEEGEKSAAPSRRSIFGDETELAPGVGGRIGDDLSGSMRTYPISSNPRRPARPNICKSSSGWT